MLEKIAQDITPVQSARIACAITTQKGMLISLGINRMKTHPLQARYRDRWSRIWLHAEIDAIVKAKGLVQGCNMYLLRVSYDHNLKPFRSFVSPCKGCSSAIEHYGIKNLILAVEKS
jgi:tRNA(Arg) A34 adenosine deaminase TadA